MTPYKSVERKTLKFECFDVQSKQKSPKHIDNQTIKNVL